MYETSYHRASSVEDAVRAMGEAGDEGKFLGGGQTLIPTMKQRLAAPSKLIDLRHLEEMKGVTIEGRHVRIGGATTHAEITAHEGLRSIARGFAELAGLIGDPAVRHMGTIGGSVANFDPAADYPAALLAMKAIIHTNKREFTADEFFLGLFETALEEDEIVTAVSFEAPEAAAYEKFRNPASRYAMTGVFVARRKDGVGVGVTGASMEGAYRWMEAEQALAANFDPAAIDTLTVDESNMLADLHGTASYRANLVKVVTKRAVRKLLG